jgi:hypothetical protein
MPLASQGRFSWRMRTSSQQACSASRERLLREMAWRLSPALPQASSNFFAGKDSFDNKLILKNIRS